MQSKTEKLGNIITRLANPLILDFMREEGVEFGIVSLHETQISKDYSYADIFVSSTNKEEDLPKFLAPLAEELRKQIGSQVNTRKVPRIRFKLIKNKKATDNIYDLISEISKKYDLHKDSE